MKKYKVGYTQGTYDMFHVGHLNLLENAKKRCRYLIVGINSDKLVSEYKNKTPMMSAKDRKKIIESLKFVDEVHIVNTLDKEKILKKYDFDCIFIGDDWKGNDRWKITEINMKKHGKVVCYLPYTKGISSTRIREVMFLDLLNNEGYKYGDKKSITN